MRFTNSLQEPGERKAMSPQISKEYLEQDISFQRKPCAVAGHETAQTCVPQPFAPYLAPGRLEVPMSRGTPMNAASNPSGEACTGSRIMEQTPTDLATNSELRGWFRGASEISRLGVRLSPGGGSPRAPRAREQPDAKSLSIAPASDHAGARGQRAVRPVLDRPAQRPGGPGAHWLRRLFPSDTRLSGLWPLANRPLANSTDQALQLWSRDLPESCTPQRAKQN